MATLNELFTNIANAIRAKTGSTATIKAVDFPAAIAGISGGASVPVDELAKVTINIDNTTNADAQCYLHGPLFDKDGNLIQLGSLVENASTYYMTSMNYYVLEAYSCTDKDYFLYEYQSGGSGYCVTPIDTGYETTPIMFNGEVIFTVKMEPSMWD